VNETISDAEQSFTSEVEQYAFDQSLANEENAGMMASVWINLIILAIVAAVIIFFTRRSARKDR
jgi:subtilase family serine protease